MNLTELWAALANNWQVIPVERFQKLVESMPHRVAGIIKVKRDPTRYSRCKSSEKRIFVYNGPLGIELRKKPVLLWLLLVPPDRQRPDQGPQNSSGQRDA
ncbi:hypothetical protein TNCV_420921 [Trichonephila clavipes]|nr:hypothetical protein TNCV_420921 [Trichonephila clavipes]